MEAEIVAATARPNTATSLADDLTRLGRPPSGVVLVHSSMRSIGWTVGAAETVIAALSRWVGEAGTLVMPAHSTQLTDPAGWVNPPVPQEWWETIREEMPPFDPAITPTSGMGVIPETFRHLPGVQRSNHPTTSFAARGPAAEDLLREHGLDDGLGEQSPLARLYDAQGSVLLLGCGHDSNTSLHLAQYRSASPPERVTAGSPVVVEGERRWVVYREHPKEIDDFEEVGAQFERSARSVRRGLVGQAPSVLMSVVELVDFATGRV